MGPHLPELLSAESWERLRIELAEANLMVASLHKLLLLPLLADAYSLAVERGKINLIQVISTVAMVRVIDVLEVSNLISYHRKQHSASTP